MIVGVLEVACISTPEGLVSSLYQACAGSDCLVHDGVGSRAAARVVALVREVAITRQEVLLHIDDEEGGAQRIEPPVIGKVEGPLQRIEPLRQPNANVRRCSELASEEDQIAAGSPKR